MSFKIKNKYSLIMAILCVIFFFVYSYLVLTIWWPEWHSIGHLVFNWPDSSANFYFSKLYADLGSLIADEPASKITENLIHARSVNVLNGYLVPMTFLPALTIWGTAFKILSSYGLFLTPALAAMSAFMFYRLVRRIWGDKLIGFWAGILMLTLAPWVYFSNFTMLPVVLFIFFIIAGSLCLAISWQQEIKSSSWWLLGSLSIAVALSIRPTETIWVLVAWALATYWQRRKMSIGRYAIAIGSLLFIFLTFIFQNNSVYGSWLNFGYLNLQNGSLPTEFGESGRSFSNFLTLLIAPFGFDIRQIAFTVYHYIIKLQLIYIVLAVAGIVLSFWRRKHRKYFVVFMLISILLAIYYGSWHLADPLTLELNTISISYVRYFMPIYLLSLPYIAFFVKKTFCKNNISGYISAYFLLAILSFISLRQTFLNQPDGLIATRQTLAGYQEQFLAVKEVAPEHAVIYSERSDKVFFPYYRVIVPQGDLPLWSRVAPIVGKPIYYYTDKDISLLSDDITAIDENGLKMEPVKQVGKFTLYQITEK